MLDEWAGRITSWVIKHLRLLELNPLNLSFIQCTFLYSFLKTFRNVVKFFLKTSNYSFPSGFLFSCHKTKTPFLFITAIYNLHFHNVQTSLLYWKCNVHAMNKMRSVQNYCIAHSIHVSRFSGSFEYNCRICKRYINFPHVHSFNFFISCLWQSNGKVSFFVT